MKKQTCIFLMLTLVIFTHAFAGEKKLSKRKEQVVTALMENQELVFEILKVFFTNPTVQAELKQKGVESELYAQTSQYEEEIRAVQAALAKTTLQQDIIDAIVASDDLSKMLQEAIKTRTVKEVAKNSPVVQSVVTTLVTDEELRNSLVNLCIAVVKNNKSK